SLRAIRPRRGRVRAQGARAEERAARGGGPAQGRIRRTHLARPPSSIELDLHPSELDLAAVVRQSVAEAEPRAAARGVELACEASDVPALKADKGRMFQLLDNLVSNAIKFTPEGGDVRVSLARVNGFVRLEVADNGIGIDADE